MWNQINELFILLLLLVVGPNLTKKINEFMRARRKRKKNEEFGVKQNY